MEKISLLNKVVKISSIDDLMFYFPDFQVKKELTVLDYNEKIIYTGPLNKRAQQILATCQYVATNGLYQYDLTDRKAKARFVYSKWGREVPANVLATIDVYDDIEFNYCCKVYWVSGRWPYKAEHEESIYELYQSSVGAVGDFIREFYEVCKDYPIGVIEQSFFTFILRSKAVDEQNVSPTYKRLLKSFTGVSGPKYKKAISNYLDSPIENRELRFLQFIYDLRG